MRFAVARQSAGRWVCESWPQLRFEAGGGSGFQRAPALRPASPRTHRNILPPIYLAHTGGMPYSSYGTDILSMLCGSLWGTVVSGLNSVHSA